MTEPNKRLAIIPARSGSKRIKNKNIKFFFGKPIISYSIKASQESGLFDEIMVSTNCSNISSIALEHGAKVPFLRSEENSTDNAILVDVLTEVLQTYEKSGLFFSHVCCIFATAPMITAKELIAGWQLLLKTEADSVIPVVPFTHPIQRAFKIQDNNHLDWFFPEFQLTKTQDLALSYHDAGLFYWVNSKTLLQKGQIYTNNTQALVFNQDAVEDIDTEQDWVRAEQKFKNRFLK